MPLRFEVLDKKIVLFFPNLSQNFFHEKINHEKVKVLSNEALLLLLFVQRNLILRANIEISKDSKEAKEKSEKNS